jgi:hypothetical protein
VTNKDLENLLISYSFTKSKNNEEYLLRTHFVLDETNDCFIVFATIKNNKIILSDNAQLLDCYMFDTSELDYIYEKIIIPNTSDNFYMDFLSINMIPNLKRFGLDLSDYIKSIIILESILKQPNQIS